MSQSFNDVSIKKIGDVKVVGSSNQVTGDISGKVTNNGEFNSITKAGG